MSTLSDAVSELCASFGLRPGDLPRGQHTALSIGALGQLHFEEREEELLVYLARDIEVGADRLNVMRAALSATHFHNALPLPVQAALHGDALIFMTRFHDHEVSVQDLERALEVLGGLQDEARA